MASSQQLITKPRPLSKKSFSTETDLQEGHCRLFELKAQGVISDEEEGRRKELIMQYMEFQQSEDDEEQSITMNYIISTVQSAFHDCFTHTSVACGR